MQTAPEGPPWVTRKKARRFFQTDFFGESATCVNIKIFFETIRAIHRGFCEVIKKVRGIRVISRHLFSRLRTHIPRVDVIVAFLGSGFCDMPWYSGYLWCRRLLFLSTPIRTHIPRVVSQKLLPYNSQRIFPLDSTGDDMGVVVSDFL